jgi:hypothetical protein
MVWEVVGIGLWKFQYSTLDLEDDVLTKPLTLTAHSLLLICFWCWPGGREMLRIAGVLPFVPSVDIEIHTIRMNRFQFD